MHAARLLSTKDRGVKHQFKQHAPSFMLWDLKKTCVPESVFVFEQATLSCADPYRLVSL